MFTPEQRREGAMIMRNRRKIIKKIFQIMTENLGKNWKGKF